jgi:hypothetical protein
MGDASYWQERGRSEARTALACGDPHLAALHVELATRCLKMAQRKLTAGEQPLPPRK